MVWLRINHTQPPFDHPAARQALLHLVNQQEVLQGIGIRASEQVPYCPAFFFCGTPLESSAGAQGLREANPDRARALLREAGYNGQRVVFMNAADSPINNAATLVMSESFRRAGLNMDVPSMDWATVTQRRNRREGIDQGGWNLFVTVANVLDGQNPLTNLYLASPCEGGLTGWPCDQQLEDLRRSWWEESDAAKRQEILHRVHARAYEVLPYINAGQFRTLAAHRANVEGIRPTTVPVFWGVTKR
jgi:peptide/nickel transport system substrate-binding protein